MLYYFVENDEYMRYDKYINSYEKERRVMEELSGKVCPNCGEKLPNDSFFCTKCGTKIDDIPQVERKPNFFKKNKKKILFGVIGVISVLAIFVIVNSIQALNLKKELMRDWYKVEGEGGSSILCILDFSDKEIEYRLETGYAWLDTTVATYDYKVFGKNKIKVLRYGDEWETITIEFNEEKSVMTVSPALTSVDDTEIWVNID